MLSNRMALVVTVFFVRDRQEKMPFFTSRVYEYRHTADKGGRPRSF